MRSPATNRPLTALSMLSFRGTNKTASDTGSATVGWLARLKTGLSATRDKLGGQLSALLGRHATIDDTLYEELETLLLSCDIGVASTAYLLEQARLRAAREHLSDPGELRRVLKDCLVDLLEPVAKPLSVEGQRPFVLLVAGVNGSGKTTSIGKLARYFQSQGKSVMLAAGDTFRAAAVEQLRSWGERNGVPVIAQERGDPAAVVFDALSAARARGVDLLIADTAGRLPTQLHLMEELKIVKRVITRAMHEEEHEARTLMEYDTGRKGYQ